MKSLIKKIILSASVLTFILGCNQEKEYKSWRFVNAPDLHNMEIFVNVWESEWGKDFNSYEAFRKSMIDEKTGSFKSIHDQYNAELFVSPGDCNSGYWYMDHFKKKFRSEPDYAGYSDREIISEASKLCYTAFNEIIYSSGYKEFLMAIGDHELGDNPWHKGSESAKWLSDFRNDFADYFTLKKPRGKSRFDKSIGEAPPRPIGTIYENTSNAVQYKNVLFITLDVFRFEGDDIVLGEHGVVNGDIAGKHLEWLENVLAQAKNIPSINHVIIQSHLPVIYPVRKYASSGMMMTDNQGNNLLKAMRKYNVDMYLAGEVHMNTVTKDSESDLIQFVGRGNYLSNYAIVEIERDKIIVKSYKSDKSLLGEMIIDKSGSNVTINGTGMLKPINPDGLQIHWSFDKKVQKDDFFWSIGDFPDENRFSIFSDECSDPFAFLNEGAFGKGYSLFGEQVEIVDGVINKAAYINDKTRLFAITMGPLYADFERTISCWIKTTAKGRRLIFNSNSYWRKSDQFFNISLNDGKLELSLRPEITALANMKRINDNKWHLIAVVVPERKARLSDCEMYVDGNIIKDINYQNADVLINTVQSNWMTIATQDDKFDTDLSETMNMLNYFGCLDDFCIWTRALNEHDIFEIFEKGKKEIYFALQGKGTERKTQYLAEGQPGQISQTK